MGSKQSSKSSAVEVKSLNHMKAELPNKNVLIDHFTIHMRENNPVCNGIE
jgi:hypothetical protein